MILTELFASKIHQHHTNKEIISLYNTTSYKNQGKKNAKNTPLSS